MDLTTNLIKFIISADIVDTIIGDIFFHNDELSLLNVSDNDDDTTIVEAITKKTTNPKRRSMP
jgi:hypothetical protein